MARPLQLLLLLLLLLLLVVVEEVGLRCAALRSL